MEDSYFFILSISKQKQNKKQEQKKQRKWKIKVSSWVSTSAPYFAFFFSFFFRKKNTSREVNCCVITPFHTTHSWLVIVLVLDTCCNALDDLNGDEVDVLTSEFIFSLLGCFCSRYEYSVSYFCSIWRKMYFWNFILVLYSLKCHCNWNFGGKLEISYLRFFLVYSFFLFQLLSL